MDVRAWSGEDDRDLLDAHGPDDPLRFVTPVVCGWCLTLMTDGNPLLRVSHGICESCTDTMLKEAS